MVNERNYNRGLDPYSTSIPLQHLNGDTELETFRPEIVFGDGDILHYVMEGETLQSIAYRYYGDSGYWSQIAEANNIINPLSDKEFYKGRKLIIPIWNS